MGTGGGSKLKGALQELRNGILDYFGALNMIEEGLKPDGPAAKPEALVLYEQIKDMGTPLVAGGIRDQPHIWMMEYRVCDEEVTIRKARRAALEKQRNNQE
jgi:hypothetical protein